MTPSENGPKNLGRSGPYQAESEVTGLACGEREERAGGRDDGEWMGANVGWVQRDGD